MNGHDVYQAHTVDLYTLFMSYAVPPQTRDALRKLPLKALQQL